MGSIEQETIIEASPDRVWAVLSDFGNPQAWSPNVTHSAVLGEQQSGVGCERNCTIPGFGQVTERATEWSEGERITIEGLGIPMMRSFASTWSIEPAGDKTRLRATLKYQPRFGPFGRLMAALVMQRKIRATLRSSVAGLKFHVETGELVGTEVPAHA